MRDQRFQSARECREWRERETERRTDRSQSKTSFSYARRAAELYNCERVELEDEVDETSLQQL